MKLRDSQLSLTRTTLLKEGNYDECPDSFHKTGMNANVEGVTMFGHLAYVIVRFTDGTALQIDLAHGHYTYVHIDHG